VQTTHGGNGPTDAGKVPLFDAGGDIYSNVFVASSEVSTLRLDVNHPISGFHGNLLPDVLTDDRDFHLPDASGTLALTSGTGSAVVLQLAASDETTDLTAGAGKVTFRMPYAMTLTGVRASVNTAPTGSVFIVDINESGTSVLSTKLSIDASEKTSVTAATAAVISDVSLADDAEITIDIDQVGSTAPGKGLKVTLIGTRA